ncbi:MAG TPA: nucleotidyltransferase family protein [Solirubrobacteraceae bacterium]|nr:nucleotidyltransferase family protein [Solirubrobacteraceae bacterium]
MNTIAGVVLAAGAGRRFGGGKQLAELEGRPLLEHALAAAAEAALDPRFVVLGANSDGILAGVDLHGHEVVLCPDWDEGMAASLRAGVQAARSAGAGAILVTLGDQPRVGAEAIGRVLGARGGPEGTSRAVRASYEGVPGHPALLEDSLFDALLELHGDEGARGVFKAANTHLVPCGDIADLVDVDEVGDLEALSRASSTPPGGARPRGRPQR